MLKLFETPTANIATIVILTGWLVAFISGLFDFTWAFLSFGIAIAGTVAIDRLARDTVAQPDAHRERDTRVPRSLRIGVAALMLACIAALTVIFFQGITG